MDKAAFGAFLAQLRSEKSLTQEQLAEEINVNYKTVSKWECGNCLPDLDTLVRLASFFKVSLYELTVEYKRVKNPLLSKSTINRIIDKNSKSKFMILNIIFLIIAVILFLFATYCCIYTVNNYNQVQIYQLVSADDDLSIKGFLVKQHNKYIILINNVEFEESHTSLKHDKTRIFKYNLYSSNLIIDKKTMVYESEILIENAISAIDFSISNKTLKNLSNNFILNFEYKNQKNELVLKTLKLIPIEQYKNNKIFYD